MSEKKNCRIAGIGTYLPQRRVTNDDLAKIFDTSDEWIVTRSGIKERRYAADGEGTALMGSYAAKAALSDAGWQPSDVEFVIFATLSPDHLFPGAGCYMQGLLDMGHAGVLDIRNQCTGFIYGLSMARALIGIGQYQRILLVCAETHSHCLEHPKAPRDIAVLFGDGAAAVALEATSEAGVITTAMHAEGKNADALKLELFDFNKQTYITEEALAQGKQFPQMDNKKVFYNAVSRMCEITGKLLNQTGHTLDDIKLVIPHQANLRISEAVREKLGLAEGRVFNNIQTVGNLTAASIPMALAHAREQKLFNRGDLLLFIAFGSGFTWGGAVVRY